MDEPRLFYRDPKIQAILVVLFASLLYLFTLGRQGAARAVVISGGYAYVSVSSDGGVRILSLQNPTLPAEVGSFDTPGSALNIALQGRLLLVADGSRGLRLLDVGDPRDPVEVGALELAGDTLDITMAGHYAFLAQGSDGVAMVDIANPSAPVLVHRMSTRGVAQALQAEEIQMPASGGAGQIQTILLFVAEGKNGLGIYDFLNPRQPAPLSYFDTPGNAMNLSLAGPYAYIADGREGIQIVNISNPAAPQLAGAYQGINAQKLDVAGDRVYIAQGSQGFTELEVSNLQDPVLVSHADTPGDAIAVTTVGSLAYVADGNQGLRIYELSTPGTPLQVGLYETPGEASLGQMLSGLYTILRGQGITLPIKVWRTILLIGFDLSLFIVAIFFWVAFFAQFVLPVRGFSERRKVINRLAAYLTGGHGPAITILDGFVNQRVHEERRHGVGVALFDTASAGVFRNPHMFTKVAGPGVVFTDRPEYLAGTIDLHPQVSSMGPKESEDPYAPPYDNETQEEYEARQGRRFDTSGLTRDGVEVVPYISVVFRLDSHRGEGRTQFGFRPESTRRAIAGEAVNPDADASADERRVPWTWLPVRVAADLWREYLRKHPMEELFNVSHPPGQPISSEERMTGFDRIVEMVRNRMMNPEVEELDESCVPTGEKKSSKEYILLGQRGIQVLAVEVRNLRFLKTVETRLIERWQATWLQRAQLEAGDIDQVLALEKRSGQDLALKEFAIAASQKLGRVLLQSPSGVSLEIDPRDSLERMVDGTLRLCIHDKDLWPRLTNQRNILVEIIDWIRKQDKPIL